MLDFKNYNDYELIYYIKDGNEAALDFMIKKYEPLIKKLTTSFIRFSDKRDDLIQEGFLILMKCIDKLTSQIENIDITKRYLLNSFKRNLIKSQSSRK